MQPFSTAAAFGCVQAHDSDYVSVYDHVHDHDHDHVHVHEGSDIVDVFVDPSGAGVRGRLYVARTSVATASTCFVCGNMSNGCTRAQV